MSQPPNKTQRLQNELGHRLAPIVAEAGYELEDIVINRVGRRISVRAVVDGDAGVDLDAVAELSRALGAALDAEDPFDSPYVLEVSSPGVDRPLTELRHWRRNVGRLVSVELDGQPVTGRVVAADEDALTMLIDGDERRVAWTGVGRGRVEVEFNRREED